MDALTTSTFWVALVEIIGINLILSGDNAVVIALACRGLPPRQRKIGVLFGTGAAIVLRIAFATVIAYILRIPALMLGGSIALMWIAIKLVEPSQGENEEGVAAAVTIWSAVWTVLVADAVMSLDNVIAIAAAAKGDFLLMALGISISIPPVVIGSTLMLWALDSFPILIYAGAGLLGWIAGELAVEDQFAGHWIDDHVRFLHWGLKYVTCGVVLLAGMYMRKRGSPAKVEEAAVTVSNEDKRDER